MLGDLLPGDIAFVTATAAMQAEPLSHEEERCIARAVDKRQQEFRGGRHAARAALRQLGFRQDVVLLPREGSRGPAWPEGYVGSITHTRGFCAAAVAESRRYRGIGIDVEPRKALKPKVLERICTERERDWIARQPQEQQKAGWGVVIFSIKESLYKVFNPIHEVFLGFHEAEVALCPEEGSFSAEILQRETGIACRYSGKFSLDDQYVYASTLVSREAHRHHSDNHSE